MTIVKLATHIELTVSFNRSREVLSLDYFRGINQILCSANVRLIYIDAIVL